MSGKRFKSQEFQITEEKMRAFKFKPAAFSSVAGLFKYFCHRGRARAALVEKHARTGQATPFLARLTPC
jgi:hypothetical protein